MLVAARPALHATPNTPGPHPQTSFRVAPEGWSLLSSNQKNDLIHGYVGAVLLSPAGDTFVGSDGRWVLLDEMYGALLASGAR